MSRNQQTPSDDSSSTTVQFTPPPPPSPEYNHNHQTSAAVHQATKTNFILHSQNQTPNCLPQNLKIEPESTPISAQLSDLKLEDASDKISNDEVSGDDDEETVGDSEASKYPYLDEASDEVSQPWKPPWNNLGEDDLDKIKAPMKLGIEFQHHHSTTVNQSSKVPSTTKDSSNSTTPPHFHPKLSEAQPLASTIADDENRRNTEEVTNLLSATRGGISRCSYHKFSPISGTRELTLTKNIAQPQTWKPPWNEVGEDEPDEIEVSINSVMGFQHRHCNFRVLCDTAAFEDGDSNPQGSPAVFQQARPPETFFTDLLSADDENRGNT